MMPKYEINTVETASVIEKPNTSLQTEAPVNCDNLGPYLVNAITNTSSVPECVGADGNVDAACITEPVCPSRVTPTTTDWSNITFGIPLAPGLISPAPIFLSSKQRLNLSNSIWGVLTFFIVDDPIVFKSPHLPGSLWNNITSYNAVLMDGGNLSGATFTQSFIAPGYGGVYLTEATGGLGFSGTSVEGMNIDTLSIIPDQSSTLPSAIVFSDTQGSINITGKFDSILFELASISAKWLRFSDAHFSTSTPAVFIYNHFGPVKPKLTCLPTDISLLSFTRTSGAVTDTAPSWGCGKAPEIKSIELVDSSFGCFRFSSTAPSVIRIANNTQLQCSNSQLSKMYADCAAYSPNEIPQHSQLAVSDSTLTACYFTPMSSSLSSDNGGKISVTHTKIVGVYPAPAGFQGFVNWGMAFSNTEIIAPGQNQPSVFFMDNSLSYLGFNNVSLIATVFDDLNTTKVEINNTTATNVIAVDVDFLCNNNTLPSGLTVKGGTIACLNDPSAKPLEPLAIGATSALSANGSSLFGQAGGAATAMLTALATAAGQDNSSYHQDSASAIEALPNISSLAWTISVVIAAAILSTFFYMIYNYRGPKEQVSEDLESARPSSPVP